MVMSNFLKHSLHLSVLSTFTVLIVMAENNPYQKFLCDTPNSQRVIDFGNVEDLLNSSVIDMGISKRLMAKRSSSPIGSHLKQAVNARTDNEGNRFAYELFREENQREKLRNLLAELVDLPQQIPLCSYNKQEQLAYWLNLHNVALLNEIVAKYPVRDLAPLLLGVDSILDRKILIIDETDLSLNDIRSNILLVKYERDPLIIYGLYQGNIGGPNILKQAFNGSNVYPLLKENAFEFINSNRGTEVSERKRDNTQVSSYYQRNADYFPDFQDDLKQHLLTFATPNLKSTIGQSQSLMPNIDNWKVTDLYGTTRTFNASANTNAAALDDASSNYSINSARESSMKSLSLEQIARLKELMRVRAKNIGGTSVTIHDEN